MLRKIQRPYEFDYVSQSPQTLFPIKFNAADLMEDNPLSLPTFIRKVTRLISLIGNYIFATSLGRSATKDKLPRQWAVNPARLEE